MWRETGYITPSPKALLLLSLILFYSCSLPVFLLCLNCSIYSGKPYGHLIGKCCPLVNLARLVLWEGCGIQLMAGCLAILRLFQQYFSHIRTMGGL